MSWETLQFSVAEDVAPQGSVGVLTIRRPQALNALNRQVIQDLRDCLTAIKERKDLRCVVFTGAGEKAFVAGADIKEMQDYTREQAFEMAVTGQKLFQDIEDCRIPTIAAVNGFALGGGLELAMACDFILASRSAKFGLPEVSLGLIPGYGGTQRLSRYVGKALARMITLTGDIYPAEKGLAWGLFAEVCEPKELMPTALKVAQSIARRGPVALAYAKDAINRGFNHGQLEGLTIEAELFAKTFATEDHVEGIRAFIEKRPPVFKGH